MKRADNVNVDDIDSMRNASSSGDDDDDDDAMLRSFDLSEVDEF